MTNEKKKNNYSVKHRFKNIKVILSSDGEKYGVLDVDGNTILPIEYDYIGQFNIYNQTIIKKNSKWGMINEKGEIILPIKFEYISSPLNKYYCVQLNKKFGFLDKNMEFVIPCIYRDSFNAAIEDIFFVQNDLYLWGALDKKNKISIPFVFYDAILPYDSGIYDPNNKIKLSIRDNYFYVSKNNIFKNDKDIQRLIRVLFNEREK